MSFLAGAIFAFCLGTPGVGSPALFVKGVRSTIYSGSRSRAVLVSHHKRDSASIPRESSKTTAEQPVFRSPVFAEPLGPYSPRYVDP